MIEIRRMVALEQKNIDQKEAGENPRGDRHIFDWGNGIKCKLTLGSGLLI